MEENFIGIYESVIDEHDCNKIIEHFEFMCDNQLTHSRQEEKGSPTKTLKDTNWYVLTSTPSMHRNKGLTQTNQQLVTEMDLWMFGKFRHALTKSFESYTQKYDIVKSMGSQAISPAVKIQRTCPGEGYHIWHCEHASVDTGRRLLLAILYLNDVEEGGETEFLYLHKRVAPKCGTLLICPSSFTHTHRGNPPLKGIKYIMNAWINFIE
jgi:hypothetical protein